MLIRKQSLTLLLMVSNFFHASSFNMLVTELVVFPDSSPSHDGSNSEDEDDEIPISSKLGDSNKKSTVQLAKQNTSMFLCFLLF